MGQSISCSTFAYLWTIPLITIERRNVSRWSNWIHQRIYRWWRTGTGLIHQLLVRRYRKSRLLLMRPLPHRKSFCLPLCQQFTHHLICLGVQVSAEALALALPVPVQSSPSYICKKVLTARTYAIWRSSATRHCGMPRTGTYRSYPPFLLQSDRRY